MPADTPTGSPSAEQAAEPSGAAPVLPQAIVAAEPAQPLSPTQAEERIRLIDVLRGLALFGIIAANMRGFAGPQYTYFRPSVIWNTRSDFWVQAFVDTFIQGKFITIFAFLFGVGFAIQFTRAEKRHGRFVRVYVRRLFALILIGVLHQLLFWWGDILISYALGGFLLIPFRKRKNKTILIWALALMFGPLLGASGYTLYRNLRPQSPAKQEESRKKAIESRQKREAELTKTVRVYQTGNYAQIFKVRLGELKTEAIGQPGAVIMTFPIFLLGLWVWRQGILQDPAPHRALLKKAMIIGAVLGIPMSMGFTWGLNLMSSQVQVGPPTPFMIFGFFLAIFGRPALSMSYACAVALLFLNENWQRRMLPFAAIGRTALSNYLFQTIVCTTIFYGYGGGLFAGAHLAWLFALSVVIYALQAPLSNWWLARHRFGPAEWIWRSMTYGKAQLRKRDTLPA